MCVRDLLAALDDLALARLRAHARHDEGDQGKQDERGDDDGDDAPGIGCSLPWTLLSGGTRTLTP